MPSLKNYYVRWFVLSFLVSALVPAVLYGGWRVLQTFLPAIAGLLFSQPVVIVTNPFVEAWVPFTAEVVTGTAAVGIILLELGLCGGVAGVLVGAVIRGVRQGRR